ncbi:MAG: DUF6036 family nucleotidyltransferase [Acidobacteriota bacterium]
MSQPAEVLAALAQAFASEGVRWYVFGAQAVMAYGRPRLTTDIDVTVELELDQVPALAARLESHGFSPQTPDFAQLAERTRVLPLAHEETGFPIDLVVAGPGLEHQFLDHAKRLDLGGVTVPVIDAPDLITAKILAGRPQDLEDIRGILLEQGPALDLHRTKETLRLLEAALDRGDLLSELERLLAR